MNNENYDHEAALKQDSTLIQQCTDKFCKHDAVGVIVMIDKAGTTVVPIGPESLRNTILMYTAGHLSEVISRQVNELQASELRSKATKPEDIAQFCTQFFPMLQTSIFQVVEKLFNVVIPHEDAPNKTDVDAALNNLFKQVQDHGAKIEAENKKTE